MITVFGDSHAQAMSWGHLNKQGLEIFFDGTHGVNWHEFEVTEIESGFHISANRVSAAKPVDINLIHGENYFFCSVLHSAPFVRHPAWNRFCPWRCADENPDLEPVSTAVIHNWVESILFNRFELLKLMQDCGMHVHVVEPPKPLTRIPDLCGNQPGVVLEVDRIMRSYVFDKLQSIGVPVIKAPAETINNGFTTDAYSASHPNDAHHGSISYYALQLEQIIKAAQK